MNVKIHKASDYEYERVAVVNSLDDLINIMNTYKHSIIIDKNCHAFDDDSDNEITITIYDDYIE